MSRLWYIFPANKIKAKCKQTADKNVNNILVGNSKCYSISNLKRASKLIKFYFWPILMEISILWKFFRLRILILINLCNSQWLYFTKISIQGLKICPNGIFWASTLISRKILCTFGVSICVFIKIEKPKLFKFSAASFPKFNFP